MEDPRYYFPYVKLNFQKLPLDVLFPFDDYKNYSSLETLVLWKGPSYEKMELFAHFKNLKNLRIIEEIHEEDVNILRNLKDWNKLDVIEAIAPILW